MRALIVVDIQNDFLPGGALPVSRGDDIIPLVNQLIERFPLVVATQDWHPADHLSFASNHENKKPGDMIVLRDQDQILWPDHCVQDTPGADFADALDWKKMDLIVRKGTDAEIDSYSGFYDNGHQKQTPLHAQLQKKGVDVLFVCGLAADFCVKFTVLDALQLGYKTFLIQDATHGVNLEPGDVEVAMMEMEEAGAGLVMGRSLFDSDA